MARRKDGEGEYGGGLKGERFLAPWKYEIDELGVEGVRMVRVVALEVSAACWKDKRLDGMKQDEVLVRVLGEERYGVFEATGRVGRRLFNRFMTQIERASRYTTPAALWEAELAEAKTREWEQIDEARTEVLE